MQNYGQYFRYEFQAPDAPRAFQMAPFYQGEYQQDWDAAIQENFQQNPDPGLQGDWNNFDPAQLQQWWMNINEAGIDGQLAPNNVNAFNENGLRPVPDRDLLEFAALEVLELENKLVDANDQIHQQYLLLQRQFNLIDNSRVWYADFFDRIRNSQQEWRDEVQQTMRDKDDEIERLQGQLAAETARHEGAVNNWLRATDGVPTLLQDLVNQRNWAVAEAAEKDNENLRLEHEMVAMAEDHLKIQRESVEKAKSNVATMKKDLNTISKLEQANANLVEKVKAQQKIIQRGFKDSMTLRRSKRVNKRGAAAEVEPAGARGGANRTAHRRRVRK
ncbi:hypothetical protein CAEBREN_06267 [Caenorhabditis brenneri]|uniref:Uncharacterized protein n=1 Tax=Caenorhabditis brenneri TaxID=135651 RepID=G0MXB3_CAEBE|nr:hypothetical protein CAEBREN_06267 [Caenorhabditis brenneri]